MKSESLSPIEGGLRKAQTAAVRERLLAAATALIEEGSEPTMRAVAARAGVGERTVYRYFAAREDLYVALGPRLQARSGAPLPPTTGELPGYIARLFTTFDENAGLVRSLATSPWAEPFLRRTRARNLKGLRALFDASHGGATDEDRAAAASALRVLCSGAGWVYLRDAGLENAELIAHARWLVSTLVERLDRSAVKGAM